MPRSRDGTPWRPLVHVLDIAEAFAAALTAPREVVHARAFNVGGEQNNVTVAGEAAYQLVLAPRSASSLVGQVRIAIDATHNVPLRVQIFARGAQSPAFQVGYTSISFVRPAASMVQTPSWAVSTNRR